LLRVVLGTSDVPDRDLLARFVASRDEEAFAEIVRRHGAMVLAVCRRVTGRLHDAEDAFQAAFLVLARRAAHIGRPELLANWLYGVAYRTALEARAARRRAEERIVPAAPEPATPPPTDDLTELRRVIDEELAKLPDKYRTALVLCDLEGLPRAAAAAQMGIPEGTLSSRLAHARKVLAERLSRRGVSATVTAVASALAREVGASAIPNTLMNITILAAVRFAPGGVAPVGVSPAVSSLTDGVLKTMLVTRLRHLFAIGLLACGLIGVGATLAQQPSTSSGKPSDRRPAVVLGPDGELLALQPKAAEPKKYPAKGIEDDDVPYGSFPTQAVVRLEDGKLVVRQRGYHYEPVTQKAGDNTITSYQRKSGVQATTHDPADVSVFDMKGNRLSPKAWKELLKNDVHALVAHDGRLPHPRELTLFKQDTLLIVLPAPPAATVGGNYYVPSTPMTAPPARVAPPAQPVQPPAVRPPQGTRPALPAPAPFPSTGGGDILPPLEEEREPRTPRLTRPAEPPENVRGTVLKDIDAKSGLVEINIGLDAGLEEGTKLDAYRETGGGKYLGTLVVKKLEPKTAVCEFRPARNVPIEKLKAEELPRKGDSVGRITAKP
jgi:RNA polymerase sigma factor (sigma-70 family)